MEVNNQTSDPVDYEQNGSGVPQDPDCPIKGQIPPKGLKEITPPCGSSPWRLWLKIVSAQPVEIAIDDITDPKMKVTLI